MLLFYVTFLLQILAQLSYGFIFPKTELLENCTLPNNVVGVCRNIKDCPSVFNNKAEPLNCYFLNLEYFVCCEVQEDQRMKILKEAGKLLQVTQKKVKQTPITIQLPTKTTQIKTPIESQEQQLPVSTLFQTAEEFFLLPQLPAVTTTKNGKATREMSLRLSQQKCRSYKRPFAPVIIKGIETGAYEFPYMVALGWMGRSSKMFDFKCGGVLIDWKFVLTAAHCAWANDQQPVFVLPGGIKLSRAMGNTVNIKKITIHPDYSPETIYNDIAIIELEKEIYDERACLWSETEPQTKNLTVIGYGHTEFAGVSSEKLLKAYLTPVPNSVCQRYYEENDDLPNGVSETQLCAIDSQLIRDACQGDSGGPLIKQIDGQDYVVGITSYGIGCASDTPSIYTRVSSYIEWIENIVWP